MGEPTLIHSVVRAFRLLELIADEGAPVPAKRLSRLSRIPLPTTYHLLRTLVHEGYALRTDEGYVLGDSSALLAERTVATELPHRVHQVLRSLHMEMNAPAYAATYRDGEVELVDIVDSPTAPRVDLWLGLHQSAHATALGKAVLGGLPHEERMDYLVRHPLHDLTRHTHTTVRALLVDLNEHRDVIVDREEYAVGTTCIAVPVATAEVVAAVALSVPSGGSGRVLDRLGPLKRAAQLVAQAAAVGPGSAITI